MKIKEIKIKNFRSYKNETTVQFGDLVVFVGKNDVGKSTILEALDFFFNNGKELGVIKKLDKDDINKSALAAGDKDTVISIVFEELPTSIVIDATNSTTLQNEYLVRANGCLEIVKKYSNAGAAKIFIKANHPNNPDCSDLLLKNNRELKAILAAKTIECDDQTKNAVMRGAIWGHYAADLQLLEKEIDTTKGEGKGIWEKLNDKLPLFSLFQSDRKNSDGDSEVQDPLKLAVQQILKDPGLKAELDKVAEEVKKKLDEVSEKTLLKLNEMDPTIAGSLNPIIPSVDSLKWYDVFKGVSIAGDDDIPINKRGSGVKRLILLNFFRAEAERRRDEKHIPSVIYAIEEPETSQHSDHQRKLIKALNDLSKLDNTQVILTTHNPVIVKGLEFSNLRLIADNAGVRSIENVLPDVLPYPSLNEANFVAFNEITEEYHNELYGFIESEGLFNDYKNGKATMLYKRKFQNGDVRDEQHCLTGYVRHQIHHPENDENIRFTFDQLTESIGLMRDYIQALP